MGLGTVVVNFSVNNNNTFSQTPLLHRFPHFSFMATHFNVSQTQQFAPIGNHDLLIVGPGVLGRLVAHQWRQVLYL